MTESRTAPVARLTLPTGRVILLCGSDSWQMIAWVWRTLHQCENRSNYCVVATVHDGPPLIDRGTVQLGGMFSARRSPEAGWARFTRRPTWREGGEGPVRPRRRIGSSVRGRGPDHGPVPTSGIPPAHDAGTLPGGWPPAVHTIHAHAHPRRFQSTRPVRRGEPHALIRVEYLRTTPRQRLPQHRLTKAPVQRVRHPPTGHQSAVPIDRRQQLQEPRRHRNVRDVRTPRLPRPLDFQPLQQVRMLVVTPRCHHAFRPGKQAREARPPHQPLDPLPVHHRRRRTHPRGQLSTPQKRMVRVPTIQPIHQRRVRRRHRPEVPTRTSRTQ